jgi:hypothetical protein
VTRCSSSLKLIVGRGRRDGLGADAGVRAEPEARLAALLLATASSSSIAAARMRRQELGRGRERCRLGQVSYAVQAAQQSVPQLIHRICYLA